jgi:hypothetical protein
MFEPLYQGFVDEANGDKIDLDAMNKRKSRIKALVDAYATPTGEITSVLFVASQSSPDRMVFLVTVKHDVPAVCLKETRNRCAVMPSLAHGFHVKIGVGCSGFDGSSGKAKRFLETAMAQEVVGATQ